MPERDKYELERLVWLAKQHSVPERKLESTPLAWTVEPTQEELDEIRQALAEQEAQE